MPGEAETDRTPPPGPRSAVGAEAEASGLLDLFARALGVAFVLAAVRAGRRAVVDGYFDASLIDAFARSFSRGFLESAGWCVAPALVLCLVVGAMVRRRVGTLGIGLVVLAAAGAATWFVTYRLPGVERYVVPRETFGETLKLAGFGLLALAGVLQALPAARLPLRRAMSGMGVAALLLAPIVLAWPRGERPVGERPNLILISLDTLRLDHLGCYGYDRETSPHIDALAERSLVFRNGFSTQPWTLTAHMSMLTGLLPSVHGLSETTSLPRGIPTVADLLSMAGYRTLGVADEVAYLSPRFGYSRGFDVYEQLRDDAALKVDRILSLLDDAASGEFFLFAHFFDAHSDWWRLPYEAAGEDLEALAPWYDGDDEAWCNAESVCASKMLLDLFENDERMDDAMIDRMIDLYDAGIRTMDREIGRLIDGLEERGLMENTVIVVTADHGEEFFDHGKPLHGRCFDECLNVPFFVYASPGIAPEGDGGEALGRVSDVLASHVDLPATLLELAGEEAPETHQGVSLAELVRGEEFADERDMIVIEQIGGMQGLRGKRWSLVPQGRNRLLFDLEADPGQTQELRGPELVDLRRELKARLAAEETASAALRRMFEAEAGSVALSEEEQAALEDLGYAGD